MIAGLALLGAALLPALARGNSDNRGFVCMNNTRQLTVAWLMYATDNQDKLISNPGWVSTYYSYLDWSSSAYNTNSGVLVDPTLSPIAAYIKSAARFKCPADTYQSSANPGPRARSYSLNGVLGASTGPSVQGTGPDGTRSYYGQGAGLGPARKMAHLNTPGPSMVFVMMDEHPDSINDAVFMLDPGFARGQEKWRDLPGNHHNGGCGLSYADGHSEIHPWQDSQTIIPVNYIVWSMSAPHSINLVVSKDYEWL